MKNIYKIGLYLQLYIQCIFIIYITFFMSVKTQPLRYCTALMSIKYTVQHQNLSDMHESALH